MLHSLGNQVIGIDIVYIPVNVPFLKAWWRRLKQNSLEIFARDFLYAILLKNKTYYNALKKLCNFPINAKHIDIRQMNAEDMSFPDNVFDIVISIAVFEHIKNVSRAISEVYRVLKKGGIAYINIHLFTSLSGGHHFDWADPRKVPPWDHLRQRKRAIPVYLNKLREHEYLSLFQEMFEILEVLDVGKGEGKDLLTPEIRLELSDYSEQELLKRGITIIARKRDE